MEIEYKGEVLHFTLREYDQALRDSSYCKCRDCVCCAVKAHSKGKKLPKQRRG